ncbi:dienelactone hydrolase [Gillisia mitskevichiae]|uniref:Dienelactone hydrolase n=1 Tax=Gillisia mitskevichiae TaxID=270921 RepID=A0A495PY01_9FLAO|nr:dienelactone hydrolase family protein [Gillisia mitskevichiae]RKS53729.1 dienelactone hydrolase [Gillisia mitskevichiae]
MDHIYSFKEIEIPIAEVTLKGRLRETINTKGLIVFSHGSGSSRLSSRNNYVAELLQGAGFSSLLFDLLTEKEDLFYGNRFNIDLLCERLVNVTNWIANNEKFNDLHIGYFGASTGAASALKAAVQLKDKIFAVVSRGGRPDLALAVLDKVTCPTLLIIGSKDQDVIELNKKAYAKLGGIKEIEIIEGATHLFSELGKLEEVAKYTIHWFNEYLK